jgi:hypothetical protein
LKRDRTAGAAFDFDDGIGHFVLGVGCWVRLWGECQKVPASMTGRRSA